MVTNFIYLTLLACLGEKEESFPLVTRHVSKVSCFSPFMFSCLRSGALFLENKLSAKG